jgi:hypothetical protein
MHAKHGIKAEEFSKDRPSIETCPSRWFVDLPRFGMVNRINFLQDRSDRLFQCLQLICVSRKSSVMECLCTGQQHGFVIMSHTQAVRSGLDLASYLHPDTETATESDHSSIWEPVLVEFSIPSQPTFRTPKPKPEQVRQSMAIAPERKKHSSSPVQPSWGHRGLQKAC